MDATGSKSMLQSFKDFLMKGNVLDLAVAIVIGVAFAGVIDALVAGVLMPLIAAVAGKPNFDALTLTIGDGVILYGTFLTQVVNFLIVGTAMFVVVRAVDRLQRRRIVSLDEAAPEPVAPPSEETKLLGEIRDLLAEASARRV